MTSKRRRREVSGKRESEKKAENKTSGEVFDLRIPGALRVGLRLSHRMENESCRIQQRLVIYCKLLKRAAKIAD